MAVQIPQVERMAPVDNPVAGQINVNLDSQQKQRDLAQLGSAGENFVGDVAHYVRTQQVFAADNAAMKYGAQYHQQWSTALNGDPGNGNPGDPDYRPPVLGAKDQQGDPTPVFANLKTDMQTKRQAILKQLSDSGASELVMQQVGRSMDAVDNKFADRVTSAYGVQHTKYVMSNSDAEAKVSTQDVSDSMAHIDPSDPASYDKLDQSLTALANARNKAAVQFGSAQAIPDPSGKIDPTTGRPVIVGYNSLSPKLDAQLAIDKSKALSAGIKNLLDSGNTDLAVDITSKYGKYLDAVHKPEIEKETKKAKDENDAQSAFQNVKNMPYADAMKALDARDDLDPSVIEKAQANLSTYRKRMEDAKEAQSKDNYNAIGKIILQSKFTDANEMQNNPAIKRMWDNVDVKQQTALMHMVQQPRDSDPDVKGKFFDVLAHPEKNAEINNGNGLKGMDPSDFNSLISGLNRADRTMAETQWRKANVQSSAQESSQTKIMASQLTKQLQDVGYVKKNSFGKYSNEDQIKLNEATSDAILNMPTGNLSPKDIQNYVKETAAKHAIQNAKSGGFFSGLFGGSQPTPTPAPEKNPKPSTSNVPGVQIPQSDADSRAALRQKVFSDLSASLKRIPTLDEVKAAMQQQGK